MEVLLVFVEGHGTGVSQRVAFEHLGNVHIKILNIEYELTDYKAIKSYSIIYKQELIQL